MRRQFFDVVVVLGHFVAHTVTMDIDVEEMGGGRLLHIGMGMQMGMQMEMMGAS